MVDQYLPKPDPSSNAAATTEAASANAPASDAPSADSAPSSGTGMLVGTGLASWYGGQFHGRLTASGERFDRTELTAAHKSLPFGSKVCVRSRITGKAVVVRINDRGPFAPGRVIDLSQAAAAELGMQGLGIKPVELWQLKPGRSACPGATGLPEDELDADDASPLGDLEARANRSTRAKARNVKTTAKQRPATQKSAQRASNVNRQKKR